MSDRTKVPTEAMGFWKGKPDDSAPSNSHPEPIAVSQEARDAADAWRRDWQNCRGEHTALVQAFQRAMTQAAEAAAKDMRERCAKAAEGFAETGILDPYDQGWTSATEAISEAIRSLPLEGKGLR